MPQTITNRLLSLAFSATLAASALAQRYEPPPPPLTTAPCKPTKKDPCTPAPTTAPPSSAFPFPGENAGAVPDMPSQATPKPDDPSNPVGTTPKLPTDPNTQGSFPFPGENPNDATGAPPAAASSSSSSDPTAPDARNPDEPALKDEGSTGSTRFSRRKLPKVEDMGAREAKDVEVARYYLNTGNLEAAYKRAKDAVTIDAEDPAAHLALAQAAQRLSKPGEALAEYQAVLANDPDDKQRKEAQRNIAALNGPK